MCFNKTEVLFLIFLPTNCGDSQFYVNPGDELSLVRQLVSVSVVNPSDGVPYLAVSLTLALLVCGSNKYIHTIFSEPYFV
jgi:hypothetical protein